MEVLAIEPHGAHPASHTKELAVRLRKLNLDWDIQYAYYPESGGAGGLAEFVGIWLPKAWDMIDEALLAAIVAEIVSWARNRLEQRAKEAPEKEVRPQIVSLYGPDGEVLRKVKISSLEEEPEDLTSEAWDSKSRDMPPLQKHPPD